MQLTNIPLLTDLHLENWIYHDTVEKWWIRLPYSAKMYCITFGAAPHPKIVCLFTCRLITSALNQRALINFTTCVQGKFA